MKRTTPTNLILTRMALVLGMGLAMTTASAALTDIANAPMANTASSVVKPNLMFLLDASGSMNWDYMPDSVNNDPACRDTGSSLQNCNFADPPYNSAQFNSIYYNPTITYTPAVHYDGTSYPSYTTWTAVPNDAFGIQFTGTIDLTTAYPDTVWCNTSSPTTGDRTAPFASGKCVRPILAGVYTYPNATFTRQNSVAGNTNPYYYTIGSVTWCSSKNASGFGTGTCQAKKTATFQYPKYGTGNDGFTRVDIVPGTTTYARVVSRTDCTGAVGATGCSYAQEMTNFANWYAYYRTRMQMMKSAAGLAFKQVTDSFRVGFITINPASPVSSTFFLPIADFTTGAGNQKDKWYTKFYAQDPANKTPLREALSRVGRYYAHVTTGINNGITDDPVQYSCQQNFTIMSTDGFWNDNAGQQLVDSTAIGNQDADPTTAPRPLLDGSVELTTVTTTSTLSQQICTSNANAFGASPCGCATNLSRVKQQTSASLSTVVSRDGVTLSTTPSTNTTYQDITACDAVITTAVTPTTKVDEQLVNGNANSTFATVNGVSAGANEAGSCAANFGRIKRRTTLATSTVVTTGGVAGAAVLGATYTFTDVGACVALTNTVVTHFTIVEEQKLVANATSTFAIVNGVAAGANQAATCAANFASIKQRTTQYNQTIVTVGAAAGAPTFSGTAYTFTSGSCQAMTTTTVTPVTVDEEQVVLGPALSTFASINGVSAGANQAGACAAGQERVKHRRTTYNSTVTTVGAGAPSAPVASATAYAFSEIGSCVAPRVSTAVTPTTNVAEQNLIGAATSTFPVINGVAAGANAAGTCAANFMRIKRRTTTYNTTVVTTDGVAGAPTTSATAYAFTDVGACIAPVVSTAVTPTTQVDEQTLTFTAMSTFPPVNGVSSDQAGTCAAGQARIKRRTTTYNTTVVTTNGVPAAPTTSAPVFVFANVGACATITTTVVTPVTETAQWVSSVEGTNVASGFSAAANASNPQTTYTCTGAGTLTVLLQRVLGYNKTVTTVGAGAPTTTYSANTSGPTFSTPTACSTSGKSAAATVVANGSATTTVTGAPTAAAQTSTNGSTTTTTTGGPTPVPAATTNTNGATTTTNTGGPTPIPAATTTVNGAPTSTQTGGPTPAATTNNNSVTSNTTSGGPTPAASTSVAGATTSTSTGSAITSANFTITPVSSPTTAGPKTVLSTTSSTGPAGYLDTLADVAQYYYITDLRAPGSMGSPVGSPATALDVGTTNNVPGQPGTDPQNDSANWQHMTTFTLGLGVDGSLTYAADYRTNPTGDFLAIKNGTKNWPEPIADTVTAVDDLWHAAVNGRGRYFSARDPAQLVQGLTDALAGVTATTGSAAAAATSNLEPVAGDNFAYVASYETVRWNGDVEARTIDLNTGAVNATAIWSAQAQLDTLANSTTPGGNSRAIKRFNASGTNKLQDFTWANLTPTEQNYFSAGWIGTGATALSHWGSLNATQQTAAAGSNLISFIRGDSTYESQLSVAVANQLYRDRQHVLGDVVDGAPVYVKQISASYTDAGFAAPAGANFKECINTGGAGCTGIFSGPRSSTVYIAANDGMLHALDGNTGAERWAYIPNILLPNLYRLADRDYANRHQFYVDGSPTVGDIYDPVAAKWKTILVGGLGAGGRGYYALDVTDPTTPIGLWEFNVRATASCPGSTVLGTDKDDCDLGLTYGNPIITKLASGAWVVVVTSGYNNVGPGDGKGYVYVLNPVTGVILKKIQAASASQFLSPGNTTTPLGLARLNNWVDDTNVDNTTLRVYGGDLQGYLWRFNLDTATAYAVARYTDTLGVGQPVTTKPELGEVNSVAMIYVGTGRYLGASDLPSTQLQTIYGIKDVTNGTAPATPINTRGATVVAQTLTNATTATGAGIRNATSNAVDLTAKNGWRADLPVTGERVNVDPKLQLGTLIIGSNIPANSACTSGGTSYLNFLDYKTGGYIQSSGNTLAGVLVGNSLVVGISVVRLPNDKTVAIVTTSDNKYPNLAPPFSTPSPTGRRSSWRELQ